MDDHQRMEHQYHALPAVSTVDPGAETDEEGDILWDQLNDAQSREVQQHESRFYNGDRYGRDNPLSIAWSMAHQTASSAGNAVRQTAEKAKTAVMDWQQNQQSNDYNNYYNGRNGSTMNHDEIAEEFDLQFGIQDLFRRGGESMLSLEAAAENHGYVNGNRGTHRDETIPVGQQEDTKTEEQPLKGYPFVVLKEGRDVPDRNNYNIHNRTERDRWGVVANLDVFLTHLYRYYYNRGLTPMLCSFLVEIICLLFTIWLTRLLLIDVNWSKVLTMHCDEEFRNTTYSGQGHGNSTCHTHLSDFAREGKLNWTPYILIHGYTFLLLAYAFFKSWVFYQDFFGYALQCRTILHDKLGLSERKLHSGALSWNEVVKKLAEGQESGSYKIIQHPTNTVSPFVTPFPKSNGNGSVPIHSDPEDIEAQESTNEQSETTTTNPSTTSNGTPSAPPAAAFDLPTNPSKLQHHQNQSLLDPLQIAQRIMRKENYMLAFWNAGLLDCTKIVFPWSGDSDGTIRHYWCGVLEWSFYQCVLNFMFNHKYELRPAFCLDSDALKRRLKVCGIVHLCLLPFLFVFTVMLFFLRHVYDSKVGSASGDEKSGASSSVISNPKWSSAAIWQFREFNELPHAFEKRMEPSYQAASEYCKLFGSSEYLAALGRLLVFFGGSIGGILFVLGVVVNDDLLLHVQFGGRNLLWYAGIAGITYSVGKSLEPTKEAALSSARNNIFEDMDAALKNVSQYTHHYPEHWKGRGWDSKVYSSFKTLFDTEVKMFLHELAALILTPYILYFRLSEKAPDICEFCLVTKAKLVLSANRSNVNGGSGIVAGDVCGFSTFDFDTFGDEAWEGRTLGRSVMLERQRAEQGGESLTESILRTGNLEDATRMHPKPRARQGKMEKSFFTFKEAHPNWENCFPPSGQSLVNRVEEYRLSTEQAMLARERELHAQAAIRQLETLARIEEEEQSSPVYHSHARRSFPTNIRWHDGHYGATVESTVNQRSLESPPPLRRAASPPPIQPTIQNTLESRTENTTASILSTERQVVEGASSPEYSLPFSPAESKAIQVQNLPSSREITRDDDAAHSQHNDSNFTATNQVQNGGLASSTTASFAMQQQLSLSRSGLTMSSSRPTSSLQQDGRGSQNQYQWLERFHEHLEKQQEEVQHHGQQRRSSVSSEQENEGAFALAPSDDLPEQASSPPDSHHLS